MQRTTPAFVTPMAAQVVKRLPEGDDWIYELKFDGYRALIIKDEQRVELRSSSCDLESCGCLISIRHAFRSRRFCPNLGSHRQSQFGQERTCDRCAVHMRLRPAQSPIHRSERSRECVSFGQVQPDRQVFRVLVCVSRRQPPAIRHQQV